jgi:hypothetical protein
VLSVLVGLTHHSLTTEIQWSRVTFELLAVIVSVLACLMINGRQSLSLLCRLIRRPRMAHLAFLKRLLLGPHHLLLSLYESLILSAPKLAIPGLLAHSVTVIAVMLRCATIFQYGALPHALFDVYCAARPEFLSNFTTVVLGDAGPSLPPEHPTVTLLVDTASSSRDFLTKAATAVHQLYQLLPDNFRELAAVVTVIVFTTCLVALYRSPYCRRAIVNTILSTLSNCVLLCVGIGLSSLPALLGLVIHEVPQYATAAAQVANTTASLMEKPAVRFGVMSLLPIPSWTQLLLFLSDKGIRVADGAFLLLPAIKFFVHRLRGDGNALQETA